MMRERLQAALRHESAAWHALPENDRLEVCGALGQIEVIFVHKYGTRGWRYRTMPWVNAANILHEMPLVKNLAPPFDPALRQLYRCGEVEIAVFLTTLLELSERTPPDLWADPVVLPNNPKKHAAFQAARVLWAALEENA